MEYLLHLLLIGMFAVGAGLVWLFSTRLRTARALRRAEQLADDEVCWTCGSDRIEALYPSGFRCLACGGLQGEGAAERRDAERRQHMLSLPELERRKVGQQLLAEAKLALIGAEGELENVSKLSLRDLAGAEQDGGREKLALFAAVLGSIGRAEQQLADAAVALSGPERFARLDVNLGSAAWVMDALEIEVPFAQSVFTSLGEGAIHREISRSREHVSALNALVAILERRLGAAQA